jgi:hypothetical protein
MLAPIILSGAPFVGAEADHSTSKFQALEFGVLMCAVS